MLGNTGRASAAPVRTERSKRTNRSKVRKTEGQYSPVRLKQARLLSILLYGTRAKLVLKTKSIQLRTVSMETVRMAKSRPRENQSKASDYFPQDYLDNTIIPSMYIPSVIYNLSSIFSGIFVRPYDSV